MNSEKQNMKWLVVTFLGMILDHRVVNISDLEDGSAEHEMLTDNRLLQEHPEFLKWYIADVEVANEYKDILRKHPEYEYLTLQEIGYRKFDCLGIDKTLLAIKEVDALFEGLLPPTEEDFHLETPYHKGTDVDIAATFELAPFDEENTDFQKEKFIFYMGDTKLDRYYFYKIVLRKIKMGLEGMM